MLHSDNPAGRLHQLLIRLGEQRGEMPLLAAWAEVLTVPPEDVILHIGRVSDLLRELQAAVDRTGDEALLAPVRRYRAAWSQPIAPTNQPLHRAMADGAAVEALALLSAQLHATASDGVVPVAERRDELRSQLRDLIDAVRDADDLPDEVKHTVVARLLEVEQAIVHIDIGGPAAVHRAMEAVVGSVAFGDVRAAKSRTFKRVGATLLVIWTAFTSAPTIQKSIETWGDYIPALQAQSSAPTDGGNGSEAAPAEEHPGAECP
ncbi:MAG TPA: hypothetical protein VKB03_03935 [Conexibacter sp.]|nr:hypothetical protein [Conexibacter sp.]